MGSIATPERVGQMTESDELRRMYNDHAADVFGYLARRVGRQLAEDLTAETFRRAVENASTFDPVRGIAAAGCTASRPTSYADTGAPRQSTCERSGA